MSGDIVMPQFNKISAILITKEKEYPEEVLTHVRSFGFGEVRVYTECDGIYWRFKHKPAYKDVYVQDDDCLTPIDDILAEYDGEHITCGMSAHHISFYADSRICLIGHGTFFPWKKSKVLKKYLRFFGKDNDYLIETDRIFTFLNFPQKRVTVPLHNLTSFNASNRLSMRKEHAGNLKKVEEKLTRNQDRLMESHIFLHRLLHSIFKRVHLK